MLTGGRIYIEFFKIVKTQILDSLPDCLTDHSYKARGQTGPNEAVHGHHFMPQ